MDGIGDDIGVFGLNGGRGKVFLMVVGVNGGRVDVFECAVSRRRRNQLTQLTR